MLRIPFAELVENLSAALVRLGFSQERAGLCARLIAEATRDGVYTHGVNRFPRFVRTIQNGCVDTTAEPKLLASLGGFERWDGMRGPGNLNAYQGMARAIDLARDQGMGCVALANTNHWMRGGTYGWQAADAGVIGICWTNTLPNLPPWGAKMPRLGNNPLVIAVPRPEGHVVLDMAMSQFSYGTLAAYRRRGELLPFDGGFDSQGKLTRDPEAIERSLRPLPIGFWKGSGLALMLDLVAAVLTGGLATHQIAGDPEHESGLSQVFLAFDPGRLCPDATATGARIVREIIEHFRLKDDSLDEAVRYPGERVLSIREENLARGIPVEEAVWQKVQEIGLE